MEELSKISKEADYVRDMMKHPGMTVMRRKVAERIARLRTNWFKAGSAEEAEERRKEARNMETFFNLIKLVLLEGQQAQKLLAQQQGSTPNKGQGEQNEQ